MDTDTVSQASVCNVFGVAVLQLARVIRNFIFMSSKLFVSALIGVGVLSGCVATQSSPVSPVAPTMELTPVQTPVTTQITEIQTQISIGPLVYKNDSYKFKFMYPEEFGFVTPNYANLEDKIVQIQLPRSSYPQTNFGDAGVYVSAVYAKSLQDCLKLNLPEGSTGFGSDKVDINGADFYQTVGNGAGAGNFYESKIYRTYHNDFCVELGETLHTSNIGNYTPGTVTEVDKDAVWQKLDLVLKSFSFYL
jgi:hypothetical protein